ncbi:MAG: hypothetical protein KJ881_04295, partial [Gammaproteobacteria bacterium]|nr:hypothetical protein [Gammaproteobacteria bacterium]
GSNLELIAAARGRVIAGRHRNRDRDSCSDRASQDEFSTSQRPAKKMMKTTICLQTTVLKEV